MNDSLAIVPYRDLVKGAAFRLLADTLKEEARQDARDQARRAVGYQKALEFSERIHEKDSVSIALFVTDRELQAVKLTDCEEQRDKLRGWATAGKVGVGVVGLGVTFGIVRLFQNIISNE